MNQSTINGEGKLRARGAERFAVCLVACNCKTRHVRLPGMPWRYLCPLQAFLASGGCTVSPYVKGGRRQGRCGLSCGQCRPWRARRIPCRHRGHGRGPPAGRGDETGVGHGGLGGSSISAAVMDRGRGPTGAVFGAPRHRRRASEAVRRQRRPCFRGVAATASARSRGHDWSMDADHGPAGVTFAPTPMQAAGVGSLEASAEAAVRHGRLRILCRRRCHGQGRAPSQQAAAGIRGAAATPVAGPPGPSMAGSGSRGGAAVTDAGQGLVRATFGAPDTGGPIQKRGGVSGGHYPPWQAPYPVSTLLSWTAEGTEPAG